MATSGLYAYDKAVQALVYNRFSSLLGMDQLASVQQDRINKGVIIMPKGIALREISEKRGDDYLSIPFINIYRATTAFSWSRNRSVVSRRGINIQNDDGTVNNVKAVPMDLAYNIWFWSQDLDLIYQCIENYSFWQHDNPKIELSFDSYTIDPEFHFSDVLDESEIEQIYSIGKYFVYRMPIKIDAWSLSYGDDIGGPISNIRLSVYDRNGVEDITTISVEDSNHDAELADALRMLRTNLLGIESFDLVANSVSTPKDRTSLFPVGDSLIIENSGENNGVYHIGSTGAVYDSLSDATSIYLEEPLKTGVVSGNIYKHTKGV